MTRDGAWHRVVRPSLVRALACGVALALGALPLAALMVVVEGSPRRALEAVALLLGLLLATGTLGGAPAAWLEAWARDGSGGRARVALACGALVALAGLVAAFQASYLEGVLGGGGVDGGVGHAGRLLEAMARDPGRALAFVGGFLTPLALTVSFGVALRLRGARLRWQIAGGALLTAAAALALGLAGWLAMALLVTDARPGAFPDLDDLVTAHPLLGGLAGCAVIAAFMLGLHGLPLSLALPPLLALSDRLGGRIEPTPRSQDEPAPEAPPA